MARPVRKPRRSAASPSAKPATKPVSPAAPKPEVAEFFVALDGNDAWSGRLASPNAGKTDGPFATVSAAQKAVRAMKVDGELPMPMRILLRGGTHFLPRPLTLTPDDSGSPAPMGSWGNVEGPEHSVTYAAYKGEKPVLSGGRAITGFKPCVIKTPGQSVEAWVADVPDVRAGKWFFTQLWVNGRRARRTRLPRQGLFRLVEPLGEVVWQGDVHKVLFTGQDQFRFRRGDLQAWRNLRDVEFVALHFWIDSRIRFDTIDHVGCAAHLQWKSRMRLTDDFSKNGAQYYVENVMEALDAPGQWYLDSGAGKVYYLPRAGETIEQVQVIAPKLTHIIELNGDLANDKPVANVAFEGLAFSHSEWTPDEASRQATPQAACHVPGAVRVHHGKLVRFERCTVSHVSTYGVEIDKGSTDVTLSACAITDLGGGGVKIWHEPDAKAKSSPGGGADMSCAATCRRVTVEDCLISDGGHRHHQAVGVLIGRCPGNKILHNHIHNFDYTGISVGWTWGYAESSAYGNIIEHNHVHDIGRGMLSDMGGIYTLGVSPGTRIRFNVFHDVESRGYGGWAIYTDEGSTDILIEKNLAYRTKSQGFHQHYGRDNIVRNNIFAFGREAQIARSRLEGHSSFDFSNNIVYCDNDGKVLAGNWSQGPAWSPGLGATMDGNVYFHRGGKPLDFAGADFKAWRKRGLDKSSVVADPLFVNPDKGDFRLRPGSPAVKLGFEPWDMSDVGPRRKPGA
ncbi:MAG: right-handed parallel beta-helix repeat-containing protein [Planctomycetota bacterium]|nr:right-handed parallel beta-helix repeat-containing protein [Planctomycetota bacterium]